MKLRIVIATLTLAACGGDPGDRCDTCFDTPDAGPPPCMLSDLVGNWRVAYDEGEAGTCGPLNDRLTSMDLDAYLDGCEVFLMDTSPDDCEWALEYECITSLGAMSWVEVVNYVNEELLLGVGNVVAATNAGGSCSSTYDITFTRL